MNTVNVDELYQNLKEGIESIAKTSLQDYSKEANSDGQNALKSIKGNLQHWAQEVENGALTTEDLAFLLKGEEGLNQMVALKEAGLAAIHIDTFKNDLINMIIGTVTSVVKI